MKKCVIIGGMGLIGLNIADLIDEGVEVYLIDNLSSSSKMTKSKKEIYQKFVSKILKRNNLHFIEEDIKNADSVKKILKNIVPDVVIYLAALLASESEKNPVEAKNVIFEGVKSTINIMEEISKKYKLIYASSSYVYGDFEYEPADELHSKKPLDIYGFWKNESEAWISNYKFKFGEWLIIRPSSVYGIIDPRERYASSCIEQAYFNETVQLFYPEFICDFTYVKDVAQIFLKAAESDVSGEIFNMTRGEARTNKEFIEVLKKYFKNIKIKSHDDRPLNAPKRGALDNNKVNKLFSWKAEYGINDGIIDSINVLDKLFE